MTKNTQTTASDLPAVDDALAALAEGDFGTRHRVTEEPTGFARGDTVRVTATFTGASTDYVVLCDRWLEGGRLLVLSSVGGTSRPEALPCRTPERATVEKIGT